jgi:hypothetical protein
MPMAPTTRFHSTWRFPLGALLLCLSLLPATSVAMGLTVEALSQPCGAAARKATTTLPMPAAAQWRLSDSKAASGQHDLGWVWLGAPTRRYPHGALGSPTHAGSVVAQARVAGGDWHIVEHALPLNRVFEDRMPRIVDLDSDGREEIVLIETDTFRGASLVVLGVEHGAQGPVLVERARGPFAGSTFRWLNPVGVADFDGDGKLDIASVVTPHIGGVLQLLHYRPPVLTLFASALDVSNHLMGALEQDLAVIVHRPDRRPTIVVPDMSHRALHALRWDAPGRWSELADLKPLPDRVMQLVPLPDGACATLANGQAMRVTLTH